MSPSAAFRPAATLQLIGAAGVSVFAFRGAAALLSPVPSTLSLPLRGPEGRGEYVPLGSAGTLEPASPAMLWSCWNGRTAAIPQILGSIDWKRDVGCFPTSTDPNSQ